MCKTVAQRGAWFPSLHMPSPRDMLLLISMRVQLMAATAGWQVIAHHYCAHINEDVRQCIIYDSDKKDARALYSPSCPRGAWYDSA